MGDLMNFFKMDDTDDRYINLDKIVTMKACHNLNYEIIEIIFVTGRSTFTYANKGGRDLIYTILINTCMEG
jgi:hypothetical protein